MAIWSFQLQLNRALTDVEVDALYEAGLSDAGVQVNPIGIVDVFREADSLAEALDSAARQIESVNGLQVDGWLTRPEGFQFRDS